LSADERDVVWPNTDDLAQLLVRSVCGQGTIVIVLLEHHPKVGESCYAGSWKPSQFLRVVEIAYQRVEHGSPDQEDNRCLP
jgi:hypothetical protein